jgi:murein DD-endopeptidase MepM/ murein hydrolase activator NlpD
VRAAGYAAGTVIAVLPCLLVVVAGADSGCAPGGTGALAVVEPADGGGDRPGGWDDVQVERARAIVIQGRVQGMPARAWVIATATAMQESGLRNLANRDVPTSLAYPHDGVGRDHDSVGVLQQRPSPPEGEGSWGTVAELMRPQVAAEKFYLALSRVPGWQRMALTDAAQAVQHSAYPTAYARWEPDAEALVAWLVGQPDVDAVGGGGPWAPCGPGALAAVAVSAQGWVAPIDAPIRSGFRPPDRPTHNGVDLSTDRGTPVHAAATGTVIWAGCDPSTGNCDVDGSVVTPGCGWYVEVRHQAGVVTRYCHLVARPEVADGDTVTAGRVLGFEGTSGNSSGPHLHFEVHIGVRPGGDVDASNAVDPVPFLRDRGVDLG